MPPLETYGSYQLMEKLAMGGMAQLFLARRLKPKGQERTVVLKRILPHLAEDTAFVTMFLDEARIAARLHHPNVVEILDLGAEGDSYFIAMEYIHGEDLRRISKRSIEQGRRMPPPLVCRVVAQACRGLDYAHQRTDSSGKPLRIVHRDVSPQNILVGFDGQVKVVDFGIAKAVDKATVTASGVIKGKHAYMSPEQALGREIDSRTDVFALGIVLYETLTGTRLFRRATDLQTLRAVSECRVDPPSHVFPGVPLPLDAIILKALAKDLNVRYQRADQLAEALEQWLGDRPDGTAEALGGYVSELFAERLERERSEGKYVPTTTFISQPPVRVNREGATTSLRITEQKTLTGQGEPQFPIENRTTDVTPAYQPSPAVDRITEPSRPAAMRARESGPQLPSVPSASFPPEPPTISQQGAGGTVPYGRPLPDPDRGKTLIDPDKTKTLLEPRSRVATPIAGPEPVPLVPPAVDLPTVDMAPLDLLPSDSSPSPPPSKSGSPPIAPERARRPTMWPWWIAAGLTGVAVAGAVTKALVDRRDLFGRVIAGQARPALDAGQPLALGGPVEPSAPALGLDAAGPAHASEPPAPEGPSEPPPVHRTVMKPFNAVPVTGPVYPLGRRDGALYASASLGALAVGDALKVVGPAKAGSKERDFYGLASVVDHDEASGEARLLFDGADALPDGVFVSPEQEHKPAKSRPGPAHSGLSGSIEMRRDDPKADVALKNASDFEWSGCEIRLPDNRALKLGATVVVRSGARQWISGSAFRPKSGAEAKRKDGHGWVKCAEGEGWLKVTVLP